MSSLYVVGGVIIALGAYEPTAPGEIHALRALYASTDGASWSSGARKNWMNGDPCGVSPYFCGEGCNGWQGVLCWGPGGHVRKLKKPEVERGVLPTQLGLLTGLAALDLARGSRGAAKTLGLSGTIPSELGRLPFRGTDADASALLLSGHPRISGTLPASLALLPDDLVRCSLPASVGCSLYVGGMPAACAGRSAPGGGSRRRSSAGAAGARSRHAADV